MSAHGGDVWRVAEELGVEAGEILDFSASVNPRGLPKVAQARLERDAADPRRLSFYPDRSARRLREALSAQLDLPAEAIVVGPGAEALLGPILRSCAPNRALVPVPAFSEYRRVCEQGRIEFVPFLLERGAGFRLPVDDFCRLAGDVAIVNNPHNPSGALLERESVLQIAKCARVLVDEAFIDYAPAESLAREAAGRQSLIVLRSLTKFYGCPALRVGYAVAHPDTIGKIRALMPAWPITQLAIDALAEAVGDREFAMETLRETAVERAWLSESLMSLGVIVFPSAANYLLIELREEMLPAAELLARLTARHRILIRNCDSYENLAPGRFIRVAVRSRSDNCRLVQALAEELRES